MLAYDSAAVSDFINLVLVVPSLERSAVLLGVCIVLVVSEGLCCSCLYLLFIAIDLQ